MERYLAKELTPAEQIEVEQRMRVDGQFKKDLSAYQFAVEAIKLSEREKLKDRFKQRDRMLDKNSNTIDPRKNISIRWLAAASIMSVLVAGYFLYAPDRNIDEAKNDSKDSTRLVQNLPVKVDTTHANVPKEIIQPSKFKQTKPEKTGPQIFAENFEPYRDDAMDPTSRSGNDDLTDPEKFELMYWEGKYPDVILIFKNFKPSQQQNDNYRFLYANALLATHNTEEAKDILAAVTLNYKSIYRTEANFFLALCEIKNEKYIEARKFLKNYLEDPEAVQKEKARKLFKTLE